MCSGAIIQSRISTVVMGCMNPKAGCGGSILNILEMEEFNHQAEVIRGIMETECSEILQRFFKELRIRNKAEKEERRRLADLEQQEEKEKVGETLTKERAKAILI